MFKRLIPYAACFIFIELGIRLSLLARALLDVEFDSALISKALMIGLWFDVVAMSFCLIPVAVYQLALPSRWQGTKLQKRAEIAMRFVFIITLLFEAVAEHLFWTEFTTRFNFIAVDYLIYTQEVVGNIVESYPVHWLLLAVGIAAAVVTWISLRLWPVPQPFLPVKKRAQALGAVMAAAALLYAASSMQQAEITDNAEAGEVAANGIYNLFYAFWHNEINYDRFYAMRDKASVLKNARKLLWEEEAEYVHDDGRDLTREIRMKGPEHRKNVILVVMESLSADYMGVFGNKDALTPNLDRLSREGVFFSNLYATGTRTVRGLEAVTLSIPPTPGQSILRRPNNEGLFSLGYIFKDRGYDTKFIYGGYGYFDNMNAFFSGNGFDVIDRTALSKEETHFANVWGICDEDMFDRALREGDASYKAGKPFMHLIMTTSNHRPFTYPDGRIDIGSHSGRFGGVKYADYSVGRLIAEAKKKPWFRDTVFVFVSDHTAGAGGKAELDPHKYHIPLIYYAPGFIKPGNYAHVASQIDTAPILLGMLNFSYYTKFYGEDLLHDDDEIPHAFISNYQKVALVEEDRLTVLSPKRKIAQYSWPEVEAEKKEEEQPVLDAIAYYQSASWWKSEYQRIPTVIGTGAAAK